MSCKKITLIAFYDEDDLCNNCWTHYDTFFNKKESDQNKRFVVCGGAIVLVLFGIYKIFKA